MGIMGKFGTPVALAAILTGTVVRAQEQKSSPGSAQTQDNMPGMDMDNMRQNADQSREAAKSANDVMADHDMKMSAHMFMTDLRPHHADDDQRAAQIVETLRKAIAKYRDYKLALADGFRIF